VLSEDFESGTGDWTEGGYLADTPNFGELADFGLTVWPLPPAAPSGAGPVPPGVPLPSGSNCVGTKIDGNYLNDVNRWLRSPDITLTGASRATLTLQQYRDIEDAEGDPDAGSIRILRASDNTELAVIEDATIDGSSGGAWEEYSKVITAAAHPDVFDGANNPVRIEFRFHADEFNDADFAGWYLDDVTVTVP
jgi:hypothetical protein